MMVDMVDEVIMFAVVDLIDMVGEVVVDMVDVGHLLLLLHLHLEVLLELHHLL